MKENVLDVLAYLFDNYWDNEASLEADESELACELEQAGFDASEINKAFVWLEELAGLKLEDYASLAGVSPSLRCFAPEELEKFDFESRQCLLQLVSQGHLDFPKLEIIIDRAMALGCQEINLEDMKQVIALVIFNLPEDEADTHWAEELFFDAASEREDASGVFVLH
ncbi:MAG: hypothetical protein CMF48_03120 [Legionellales bacterium]|nr:hypothetical protein [Legionellales bacterium]|tara:strand:- start:271 stop:774 length:504 start_codon:yes stop_codon:yes gene_type:complete